MADRKWSPGALMALSGGYWQTCALHAAVKLGVFTVLGDRRLDAAQLAEALGADPDAAGRLLDALSAMGLLEKRDGAYRSPEDVRQLLDRRAPGYLGHIIEHHHHLMAGWTRLDRAVITGEPQRERTARSDEQQRESFLMGMFNIAMATAPKIVPLLDLGGRRRLLDLGGGPGTYAIHFCRRHPQLTATVFDLPATRPVAERTIARFELGDRIAFQAGDYLDDPLGEGYDVVWMSHILHAEGLQDCERLVRKAAQALVPGGLLAVHEFILDDSRDGPLFPALFSLNMLIGTPSGRAYTEAELRGMLAAAGIDDVRRLAVDTPNESALLVGMRRGR